MMGAAEHLVVERFGIAVVAVLAPHTPPDVQGAALR